MYKQCMMIAEDDDANLQRNRDIEKDSSWNSNGVDGGQNKLYTFANSTDAVIIDVRNAAQGRRERKEAVCIKNEQLDGDSSEEHGGALHNFV